MAKIIHTTDLRGMVKNATVAVSLLITYLHQRRAVCGNPAECVVAQALHEHFGDLMEFAEVGSTTTKIKVGNIIWRYKTPNRLGRALLVFDKTGKWELPPGQYTLLPYTAATYRWDKKKKKKDAVGGKQDMFRGRAVPTRRVMSVKQMLAA